MASTVPALPDRAPTPGDTSPPRPSRLRRRLRVLLRHRPILRRLGCGLAAVARETLPPLVGIGAAVGLFLIYTLHSAATGPVVLTSPLVEQTMVAGVLFLLVAVWTHWRLRRRYLRFLRDTGQDLSALREKGVLALPNGPAEGAEGLGTAVLTRPLSAIIDCYRQALAQLTETRTALEEQPTSSRTPGQSSRYPSFPFERSRQQMVGRLTPNLRWQTATPLLLQILGRTVERLNGRPFLRFVHPDDREHVEKALGETLKEGESHNLVFRILPAAQPHDATQSPAPGEALMSYRYLQADVLVYYDGDGRPQQLRCHFIDVTDRVQAEKALRRRTSELTRANDRLQQINRDLERLKESYRDLYHHAPVMYFSLDERGRFAAVNETMLRELGFHREELLGQPYPRILGPESREAHRSDPGLLHRSGEVETRWVSKDGRIRDVWVGTSTIKNDRGQVVRSRCAAADITERNQLAQAVVGRARDLELANTELRRINQELEEFTYVVSHDLKEPLRTVEAFSSFLEADYGTRLDEDGREYIAHLVGASRRLGKLIDDLLTLSRAGRVIGAPQSVDWEAILNTVLSDLLLMLTRRPGCEVRVEKPLPVVQGDPERITQLLANLVGNALKYNDNVQPEVVVGAMPEVIPGPMATLYVRDNGMGIDPRYHEQIFRIFRRLHRRDEFEGTGAGLAICKKIVEAHGGRLWVESTPEQGSTFFFTLPRQLAAPELGPRNAEREDQHP